MAGSAAAIPEADLPAFGTQSSSSSVLTVVVVVVAGKEVVEVGTYDGGGGAVEVGDETSADLGVSLANVLEEIGSSRAEVVTAGVCVLNQVSRASRVAESTFVAEPNSFDCDGAWAPAGTEDEACIEVEGRRSWERY